MSHWLCPVPCAFSLSFLCSPLWCSRLSIRWPISCWRSIGALTLSLSLSLFSLRLLKNLVSGTANFTLSIGSIVDYWTATSICICIIWTSCPSGICRRMFALPPSDPFELTVLCLLCCASRASVIVMGSIMWRIDLQQQQHLPLVQPSVQSSNFSTTTSSSTTCPLWSIYLLLWYHRSSLLQLSICTREASPALPAAYVAVAVVALWQSVFQGKYSVAWNSAPHFSPTNHKCTAHFRLNGLCNWGLKSINLQLPEHHPKDRSFTLSLLSDSLIPSAHSLPNKASLVQSTSCPWPLLDTVVVAATTTTAKSLFPVFFSIFYAVCADFIALTLCHFVPFSSLS